MANIVVMYLGPPIDFRCRRWALERCFRSIGISVGRCLKAGRPNGVNVEPEEMARLIDLKVGSVNVKFWLGPETDLICYVSWIPLGLEVQTFYLDGLSHAQMEHVKSVLVGYMGSFPGTSGHVLDIDGGTAEYDWNSFFDAIDMGDHLVVKRGVDEAAVKFGSDRRSCG